MFLGVRMKILLASADKGDQFSLVGRPMNAPSGHASQRDAEHAPNYMFCVRSSLATVF